MAKSKKEYTGPKILCIDIETTPLEVLCWGMWEQNIGLHQIQKDWSILSWAAVWLHEPNNKIMYQDTRGQKDIRDDSKILKKIHELMDEADIILGQNSDAFDIKKLNARFVINKMKPPSSSRRIDTKKIAKKNFAFTSNSLEYMTTNLNKKEEKMKNSGFSLWERCLKGELAAFKEMEKYNKQDVISTRALYEDNFQKWDNSINFSTYSDNQDVKCNCGSSKLQRRGFNYTNTSKNQRLQCVSCGKWHSSKTNLLSKSKKQSLLK